MAQASTMISAIGQSRHRPLAPAVFVTGKGGVGKSTVAAGLAVAAAVQGERAIVVEFGEATGGKRALEGAPASVEHRQIEPERALIEGASPMFGSAWLAKAVMGSFAMRPLLRAAPAVRELAMLEAVRKLVHDNPGRRIVVDLPATGHGLAWLAVAEQGRGLTKRGPIFDLCDRLVRELIQPGRLSIVVVTMPERLVLRETRELCLALSGKLSLPVDRLIVNRVAPAIPPGALAQAREIAAGDDPIAAAAARSLLPVLIGQQHARQEVHNTLSDSLGPMAPPSTLLPNAPKDPSARLVAQWLIARSAG